MRSAEEERRKDKRGGDRRLRDILSVKSEPPSERANKFALSPASPGLILKRQSV